MQDNFLTKISHEVRTPINAIIGLGFLFQQTRLDDQQRKYLSTIIDSAQNLLETFQSILDFTTTEEGTLELTTLPFYVETLINNVASTIRIRCKEKGLNFSVSTAADVPPALVGDSIRISQILLNIANNAVKFSHEGGVTLQVDMADVGANLVRFTIRDTGIGIPQEYTQKIFDPFMQVDNSHTRTYGGAGLGLSTCMQLVKHMKGSLTVAPNTIDEAGGSIFTVVLPLLRAEEMSIIKEGPLNGKKLLLLDHDTLRQQVISNTLRCLGINVVNTHDPDKALRLISEADAADAPFTFAIMAWQMADMDSMETAQYIKQMQLVHLPPRLVLMSNIQMDQVEETAKEIGFSALVQTPATQQTYEELLTQALKEQEALLQEIDAANAEEEIADDGPVRILLVEDNEINQEIAYEVLTSAEYVVDIANNGQEAVDAVEKCKYHVVLMDIQMPVLDGLEATKRIRAAGHKLPIIAMTAHGMADDKEISLAAGMNAHLTKPLEPRTLFATINEVLPHKKSSVSTATTQDAPKEATQVTRREKLPNNLAGFNLNNGLAAVAGNVELYISLLRKFADRYATINKDISDCLQQNDMETAIRHAHTVRGIAANLGAEALSSAAESLEKAIMNSPAMTTPLLRTLVVRLTETVDAIHGCFGSSASNVQAQDNVSVEDSMPKPEREYASLVLKKAILHMDEDWGHAIDTVDYLLKHLQNTKAEKDLLMLKQYIEDFEVEKAQELSHVIQSHLKVT